MIENEEQLQQTRLAIINLESALASLNREVLPINPQRFILMAEPVIDQIRELRQQVEEYIGLTSAISQEADLWMRLQGPEIELGDAPTSIITAMLDILRVGVQAVAEFLQRGVIGSRPTAELKDACDLRILGWRPGSVQVGLKLPASPLGLFENDSVEAQVREALDLYLHAADWVGSDRDTSALEVELQDDEQRRLLLNQVARLVPRPRGGVELVELSGKSVRTGSIQLSREARARIRNAISHTLQEDLVLVEGVLREIDLDQRTFIIRDLAHGTENRCSIPPEYDDLLDIARDGLDHRVAVLGMRVRDTSRHRAYPLQVKEIEILGDESDESSVSQ
ncbi:MAG: hypothetical protein ABW007_01440 [Chitinophagaceae bacterium]